MYSNSQLYYSQLLNTNWWSSIRCKLRTVDSEKFILCAHAQSVNMFWWLIEVYYKMQWVFTVYVQHKVFLDWLMNGREDTFSVSSPHGAKDKAGKTGCQWDDLLKRERCGRGKVHVRRGCSSSNVVACSLCPLQKERRKKTHCSMSPPPQFADQWCLEVRLSATGDSRSHTISHLGGREGKWWGNVCASHAGGNAGQTVDVLSSGVFIRFWTPHGWFRYICHTVSIWAVTSKRIHIVCCIFFFLNRPCQPQPLYRYRHIQCIVFFCY